MYLFLLFLLSLSAPLLAKPIPLISCTGEYKGFGVQLDCQNNTDATVVAIKYSVNGGLIKTDSTFHYWDKNSQIFIPVFPNDKPIWLVQVVGGILLDKKGNKVPFSVSKQWIKKVVEPPKIEAPKIDGVKNSNFGRQTELSPNMKYVIVASSLVGTFYSLSLVLSKLMVV